MWGCIAAVCLIGCLLYKSKRVKRMQKGLIVHKILGVILLLSVCIHVIETHPVWMERSVWVLRSGGAAAVILVLVGVHCLVRRKADLWKALHRIGAWLIALLLLIHVGIYIIDCL